MKLRLLTMVFLASLSFGLGARVNAQVTSARDLVALTPENLEALFRAGHVAVPAAGWVKGQALVRPGTSSGAVASRGAGVVWQGKRFKADGTARNRFFGLPIIEGKLSQGPSWLDGQPVLVLDYAETSRLYRPYRDEIREVAPGVFLGMMFDRRTYPPKFVRYFALDTAAR